MRCSPSSHHESSLSRSFLTELVSRPFFLQHERTTCCSRAHLHRACVRPLLPCATRAARVLRTKSRRSSRFSLVSFSPLQRSTPRALAHPLVTLLSLVAHGRRRPCFAPFAPSRSRPSCVLQLVLRVRHAKHAPPLFFLFNLLYPPARSRRDGASATSTTFSVLFFHLPSAHFGSIFIPFSQLAHCSFSVARALVGIGHLFPFSSTSFSFVRPLLSYPLIRATFSIQPQRYPPDYRLLFLRAHPASQVSLRVRRASKLFSSPSSTVTISLSLHFTFSVPTPSILFILLRALCQRNMRNSCCTLPSSLCTFFALLFYSFSISVPRSMLSFH